MEKVKGSWIKEEIARYERRIDKIKNTPDQTKLKSNLILYEMERDQWAEWLGRWEEGEPFIWADGQFGMDLALTSMGLISLKTSPIGDRQAGRAMHYLNIAKAQGWPEYACDRTIIGLAMAIDGDLPPPSFVIVANAGCNPMTQTSRIAADFFKCPLFTLDVPTEQTEAGLVYLAEQIRELIAALEKTFGVKFDVDKLAELQETARKVRDVFVEAFEYRRAKPCPISGQDGLRITDPIGEDVRSSAAAKRAMMFAQTFRDELRERVEKGISPLGGVTDYGVERMRVLWTPSFPFYSGLPDFLGKRGVASPHLCWGAATRFTGLMPYYGDETEYGRKLNPFEEAARPMIDAAWLGTGERWVKEHVMLCKGYNMDGCIYFLQSGCTPTSGRAKIVADRLESELGIPTFLLTGRMLDPSNFHKEEVEATLEDFIELCLARKQG